MLTRAALVSLALLVSTEAVAASKSQFDYVCTGASSHIDAVAASYIVDKTPIEMRLSIDLKARKWCYQDTGCTSVLPIASIDGDRIYLMTVKTELNEASFDIDRATGAYTRRLYTPQYAQPMTSEGQCVLAPFTRLN